MGRFASFSFFLSRLSKCYTYLTLCALVLQEKTGKELLKTLSPLFNDKWHQPSTAALVSPFSLPPQTLLILADVDAGSNTPSMVGKVLAWKKASPVEGLYTFLLFSLSLKFLSSNEIDK